MKIISNPLCLLHDTGTFHPESKARFLAVDKALREGGFLTNETLIEANMAHKEDLLCHSSDYIETVVKEVADLQEGDIKTLSTGDVLISKGSLKAALAAQGSVLAAADTILKGKTSKVFVNARPPGHHASRNLGRGFCIFNNIANCALRILTTSSIKRILIIDFDVHHGDGTQEIFYKDPRVFYFSIHQEGIYPGTGFKDERGEGGGTGTTMNYPINPGPFAEKEAFKAFQDLKKAMEIYRPEFILISAGFDAHELDPLGGLKFKTETYSWMTQEAISLAERFATGRVISILEGGYNLDALSLCIKAHLKIF